MMINGASFEKGDAATKCRIIMDYFYGARDWSETRLE